MAEVSKLTTRKSMAYNYDTLVDRSKMVSVVPMIFTAHSLCLKFPDPMCVASRSWSEFG
jgi:hypothetical protein